MLELSILEWIRPGLLTDLLIYLTYFGGSFILSPSFRLDIYQMTSSKPDDVKRVGESNAGLFFNGTMLLLAYSMWIPE